MFHFSRPRTKKALNAAVYALIISLAYAPAAALATPYTDGRFDGGYDGTREGNDRGRPDGQRDGYARGHSDGFARCAREEAKRQYDRGYNDGYHAGALQGATIGERDGRDEGVRRGESEGTEDGTRRADQDARRDAEGPGTQKGIEEANQSDAAAQGDAQGQTDGDHAAQQKAEREDYPAARKAYAAKRWAEKPAYEDSFSQLPSSEALNDFEGLSARARLQAMTAPVPPPDYRYFNPRRTYPTPAETQEYQNAYRAGYWDGFRQQYTSEYDRYYSSSYRDGDYRGCQEALSQDYRREYERGRTDGYQAGYASGYRTAYERAYATAYQQAFGPASQRAYQATYPVAYNRHFEAFRASAYKKRYQELYDAAYDVAYNATFAAKYPSYQAEARSRGERDEAAEFDRLPVRLSATGVLESEKDGVAEPGEVLRIRVKLRNFGSQAVPGENVVLRLKTLDPQGAVISESEAPLRLSLRGNSQTEVNDALGFQLTEAALARAVTFHLDIVYRGEVVTQTGFNVLAQYRLKLEWETKPQLKEGIPTTAKLRVTNQSQAGVGFDYLLKVATPAEKAEVLTPTLRPGALQAGASTSVEVQLVGRTNAALIELPIAVVAEDQTPGRSRRIGLLDQVLHVPLQNNYRIETLTELGSLRNPGLTRVSYRIQNLRSPLLTRGLQLHLRFRVSGGDPQTTFKIVGPHPQYLKPIDQGQEVEFAIPILALQANDGGELELEVQEDGDAQIIHRARF